MSPVSFLRVASLVLSIHFRRLRTMYLGALLVLVVPAAVVFWYLFVSPVTFHPNTTIGVDEGVSVRHEAAVLKNAGLIRSTLLFRVLYRVLPGQHGVRSGYYVFPQPVGELALARALAYGTSEVPQVRITFPEGTTVRQMGATLAQHLPKIDEQKFDSVAIPEEGYLFPDTYFFRADATTTQVISIMKAAYANQGLEAEFRASPHPERDVVIMASLLEAEGKTLEDRRVIAGILWKRMAIGMPLQVDAAFGYIYGRTGYAPTQADLKSNSAYNTYRYKGLPPTPINNPGRESLLAALTPAKTDYLYYLTGDDGQMHYAKTFAEHISNQKKYFK